MFKRLISSAAVWVGRRRGFRPLGHHEPDPQLDRYIAASLTDETLAWALGTWRKRYL